MEDGISEWISEKNINDGEIFEIIIESISEGITTKIFKETPLRNFWKRKFSKEEYLINFLDNPWKNFKRNR